MTKKEFENLKSGDIILRGKREAQVERVGYNLVFFRFCDTRRSSARGYRGLQVVKDEKTETNS